MHAFQLADGSLLRYHDLPGRPPAILFVHGLGCAGSCDYPRVAREPALAGRRILLVDLLGFGFSDRPEGFGYAVEDHARALAELVDGLGLAPLDLFGHSMGGAVAIVLAGLRPAAVARLVVCEPNLVPGGGLFSRPIAAQPEGSYLAGGHAAAVRAAREQGHPIWSGSAAVASPLAFHRGAASLVRGAEPSWLAQLAALAIPRSAIYGARSLPDQDAGRLERLGLPLRVVAAAGHSMAWENPAGRAAAIAEALP
jgi:pimeloyl-ACP methyl ester carboxylesterase